MKLRLYLSIAFLTFFNGFSQIIPNGTIDNIDELVKKYTTYIPMEDGTRLATDIFVPMFRDSIVTDIAIGGNNYSIQIIPKNTQFIIYDTTNISPENYRLPIIFTRTPYDRTSDDVGWKLFPFMGYTYAIQDMRGRYESEGVYFPLYSDGWPKEPYHPSISMPMDVTSPTDPNHPLKHHDGSQAVFYLADSLYRIDDVNSDGIMDTILFSNGKIGMFGASALGYSQYQALSDIAFTQNNPIKCLMPVVATNEHYNTTLFNNGVYRNSLSTGWITGQLLSGVDNSLNGVDGSIYNNIHSPSDYNYTNNQQLADDLIDWLTSENHGISPSCQHPTSLLRTDLDASMAPINSLGYSDGNGTVSRYKNLNTPIYHLTGWWDIFVNGQVETFNKTREQNPGVMQKLVIGPWTHQTVGSNKSGDITYPDNVYDVLKIDLDIDPDAILSDSTAINKMYQSEVLGWYRKNLGGEPYFIIPQSNTWQTVGTSQIRIPSKNYIVPYYKFLNYIAGLTALNAVPVEIDNGNGTISWNFNLPAMDQPLIQLSELLTAQNTNHFDQVKDVRLYITGPTNDAQNAQVGNYWLSYDSIPFKRGIYDEVFYLHKDQTIDGIAPTSNEGTLSYIADPNNPIATVGGNNMIPYVPNGPQKSQGSMDLSNPQYDYLTMNRNDVLSFVSSPLIDTLTIVGFPKAKIYAKGKTSTYSTVKTDFDVMVRILDVYPDGREMFITEGVVNAKAREYAKSISQKDTNDALILTNINNDEYYYFEFDLLPLGHTFGEGHQLKFLLGSSNFPKYQSNPHVPNEDGEFFRWWPGCGRTYTYQGQTLTAQSAEITYEFNAAFPSFISLPRLDTTFYTASLNAPQKEIVAMKLYPNPATNDVTIMWNQSINGDLIIYDFSGNIVKRETISGNQYFSKIDLIDFDKGIYLVRIPELNSVQKLIVK
ncbi:MAG: CocE/NonD family hydrolase [Crocinitomicaceae bacterium]|nr:CocE/NonD family hydrolase [Crocinitomicaceae bacterium]